MKRLITAVSLGLILLTGGLFLHSCEKNEPKYELTVVVTINDTIRVQNATVRVYAPVKPTYIDYYNATDEKGETHYEFPNKVIVNIVANKGPYKACSFGEVDPGSNTVVIDLKPYGSEDNGCDIN